MNRSRSIIILVGGGGGNECINRRGLNTTIATQRYYSTLELLQLVSVNKCKQLLRMLMVFSEVSEQD